MHWHPHILLVADIHHGGLSLMVMRRSRVPMVNWLVPERGMWDYRVRVLCQLFRFVVFILWSAHHRLGNMFPSK